jgi:hypothetical protein
LELKVLKDSKETQVLKDFKETKEYKVTDTLLLELQHTLQALSQVALQLQLPLG